MNISFTESAVDKMRQVVGEQEEDFSGIRVAVEAGGCSGFQYAMKLEKGSREGDEVFDFNDIRVFVDEQSQIYLDGATVDYVSNWKGEGFEFKNPNSTGTCGCGESFSA